MIANAGQHIINNFEQGTDLKTEKADKQIELLGKLVDADFFMLFKDPDSMAMDPAGVRIQEQTEIFNAKLGCVSNVLKSYNAKLGDESKPSDEANSASNRLVHAHTGSFD